MGNEIIYTYEYTFYFKNTIQLSLTIEYVARKIAMTENHCLLFWEYLKLTLQSGFKTCFVKLFVYFTTFGFVISTSFTRVIFHEQKNQISISIYVFHVKLHHIWSATYIV